MVIDNSKDSSLVAGTSDADSIYNDGDNLTVNGGAGNDTVENDGASVSVDAGTGNDYIYNHLGHYAVIDAGAGNDYINNGVLWGGTWYEDGSNVTINTGAGEFFNLTCPRKVL